MSTTPKTAEQQLREFIDKFDSKNAALIRSVRKELRKRLPAASELVYDNRNFFVIGYRIESAATLARPEVEQLIAAAVAQARTPLPAQGRGKLIIRSIADKQRPRRHPPGKSAMRS
jgi:hypothetical protein